MHLNAYCLARSKCLVNLSYFECIPTHICKYIYKSYKDTLLGVAEVNLICLDLTIPNVGEDGEQPEYCGWECKT